LIVFFTIWAFPMIHYLLNFIKLTSEVNLLAIYIMILQALLIYKNFE
jgi:hypothetical protein